jgi:UDP-MurNAc hydroxylase
MEEIRFISHSCLYINVGGTALLCDPWFFGKVFDDSWDLLLPPDTDNIDFDSIRYVWISHEHPDHFNVLTLKFLKEKLRPDVKFFYRKQSNASVIKFLRKMGFDAVELEEGKTAVLEELGSITSYHHRDDTALLIQTPENTIVNQNDCQLGARACRNLKKKAGKIDILLYQFSLAGFNGDPGNTEILKSRQQAHLNRIKHYFDEFQPRWYVPFASFVVFCTPYNEFMNRWRVSLERVASVIPENRLQIVYNDEEIGGDEASFDERNEQNLERWQSHIEGLKIDLTVRDPVEEEVILKTAREFIDSFKGWPPFSLPPSIVLKVTDIDRYLILNFRSSSASVVRSCDTDPAAELPSHSLEQCLSNPWGADTLNISAEAKVYNTYHWRWLLFSKQYLYKPITSLKVGCYAPRVYAFLKPYL